MTYAEFVVFEERSDTRHEFLDGRVFAMAGGTPEHGALAAAMIRELGAALAAKPCRVFNSDVRVRIAATGLTTYPDLSVVCGRLETDPEDRNAITNPIVIVEVVSDSTEAYDRGAKAAHYRRVESLQEYVIVPQEERRIEVYRRLADGGWELREAGPGQAVVLSSIQVSLEVDVIYRNPLEGFRD